MFSGVSKVCRETIRDTSMPLCSNELASGKVILLVFPIVKLAKIGILHCFDISNELCRHQGCSLSISTSTEPMTKAVLRQESVAHGPRHTLAVKKMLSSDLFEEAVYFALQSVGLTI